MKNAKAINFLVALLFVGCASKEKLVGTTAAPAAQGKLVADKGDNGNTDLKLTVEHLAPAGRVASGATNYIVWIQPEGTSSFQNVGALTVDDDLEGKYETKVPYKSFRVLVTPEPGRSVVMPSGPAVFDQSISR